MNFFNTERLLRKKLENKDLDTYAILIHCGDEEVFLSVNADEYTCFDAASMGKVLITSTLILQAIGGGNLSLDDTLDMFFDDVDDDKKKITVKQMLTHTSGILRKPIVAGNNDEIAKKILSYSLGFVPGTQCQYSCNAFMLLGFILEKIYGKTLEEVYQEKIVTPLGLKRSPFEIALDEPNAALCYRWKETPSSAMTAIVCY